VILLIAAGWLVDDGLPWGFRSDGPDESVAANRQIDSYGHL
jgi:hypothetical protein